MPRLTASVWQAAAVGFPAIESLMITLPERGIEWEYGNVYDEKGKPLGWWE